MHLYHPLEIARRIYRELVTRRTKVKVVPATATALASRPIFIVGVFRSGTTLLRYVIDSHSAICCPPESNFLKTLAPLVSEKNAVQGLENMGFDRQHVLGKCRELATYFFDNYAAASGKRRGADKSPRYVDVLPFIDELFPEAQYLIIHRHGLDVAHSMSQNGTVTPRHVKEIGSQAADPRAMAAEYWKIQTLKILEFEKQHPDCCLTIGYDELCGEPEHTMKGVFRFLEESWEDRVLRFHEHQHDRGGEDGRVIGTRDFVVSEKSYLQWPVEVRRDAEERVGEVLGKLGYR